MLKSNQGFIAEIAQTDNLSTLKPTKGDNSVSGKPSRMQTGHAQEGLVLIIVYICS